MDTLHSAISRHVPVHELSRLLSRADFVDAPDEKGWTPLMLSVLHDYPEALKLILTLAPEVDRLCGPAGQEESALHVACAYNRVECVKLLLAAGADPNTRDHFKRTALINAADNADPIVIKRLIDANADINAITVDGRTPLINAVGGGGRYGEERIRMLLDAGANHEYVFRGGTAVHQCYYVPYLLVLVEGGANINALDDEGKTILHHIAKTVTPDNEFGSLQGWCKLISVGAKPEIADKTGKTAFEYISDSDTQAAFKRVKNAHCL